jgi:arylamine N-acetyltransferase
MKPFNSVLDLMEQKFRGEPFHTLQMLYGESVGRQVPGGTCSDKTLSFIHEARKKGFDAKLHTAFIDGKEIHRLARLNLDGRVFFADVGNGWPSLHPYPADEQITHSCFGVTFRTEINDDMLSVYYRIEDKEQLQMEIMLTPRPEEEILNEIKERFSSNIAYPFTNRMRFSAIVDDEFRFLRENVLFIYREGNVTQISVAKDQWQNTLLEYFGWDVKLTLPERS